MMHSTRVRNESSVDIAVFYLLYHMEFLENGMDFLKNFRMISGKGHNTMGGSAYPLGFDYVI